MHDLCAQQITAGLVSQGFSDLNAVPEVWARICLGFWWLLTQVLLDVYAGNLVAVLTVPATGPVLHTVEDVVVSDFT